MVFNLSYKLGDIKYISNFRLRPNRNPRDMYLIFSMPHLHFPHGVRDQMMVGMMDECKEKLLMKF